MGLGGARRRHGLPPACPRAGDGSPSPDLAAVCHTQASGRCEALHGAEGPLDCGRRSRSQRRSATNALGGTAMDARPPRTSGRQKKSNSSGCGGGRASVRTGPRWAARGWARILVTTGGSSMVARKRRRPPQPAHERTSMANTRRIRSAHAQARRAGAAPCAGPEEPGAWGRGHGARPRRRVDGDGGDYGGLGAALPGSPVGDRLRAENPGRKRLGSTDSREPTRPPRGTAARSRPPKRPFRSFFMILPLAFRGRVSGRKRTFTGTLNAASFCGDEVAELVLARVGVGLEMDDARRLLAERPVRNADDGARPSPAGWS